MAASTNRIPRVRFPIRTPRLKIELPSLARVSELPPLIGDWEVVRRLLVVPYPYRKSDALTYIRNAPRRRREGVGLSMVIVGAEDDRLMGGIGLHDIDWTHRHAEIGYWLARRHWGQGYGSEAIAAVLGVAFRTLRLHKVEAGVLEGNRRSEHVLRKARFRAEGVRRETFYKWGKWTDDVLFGLTVDEWRAGQPRNSRIAVKRT